MEFDGLRQHDDAAGLCGHGLRGLDAQVVAALDALLGAARAYFERSFSDRVFVISFLANVVTATLLVFLGNQLGVGSQLQTAVIVVLGIRIFSNVSAIRRFIFRG